MSSSTTTAARFRAVTVLIAPVVLLAAFGWHPYLPGRLPNDAAVADAVAADATRWGVAHLSLAVAFGLVALAFVAVRGYLREAGDERWSRAGLPLVILGCTLYAVLPGMEFAPLAAVESGGDVAATQAVLEPWFVPVLVASAALFALGALCFAAGVVGRAGLTPGWTWVVAGALVLTAVARFVPLAAVQLYVQGVTTLVALWPLGFQMWRLSHPRPAGRPESLPAV